MPSVLTMFLSFCEHSGFVGEEKRHEEVREQNGRTSEKYLSMCTVNGHKW